MQRSYPIELSKAILLTSNWSSRTTIRGNYMVSMMRKFYLLLTGQVEELSKEIDDESMRR